MTNLQNPDNQPEPNSNRRSSLLLLSRAGLGLGVPLLVGLVGGSWWLWMFVQKDLAPLVQKNLTQTLKRPVQLGRVERFSLNGLRFGPTSVPATPTDPDRASVKAVEVGFDPLQLLFTRTLKLNVTLVQPDVYIEQDAKGSWLSTSLAEQEPGLIKIELDTIQVNKADVALVPYQRIGKRRVPFTLAQVNGSGQLLDENQRVKFYLDGQPVSGGNFKIQGKSRFKTQQTNLQVQGQKLLGAELTRLVELPVEIQTGRVDGNLTVQLRPDQQPTLLGTAGLNAVTAKFDQLPQPFINTQGTLRFQGTQIGLENISTSFGKIPLLVKGGLDTAANYNITARLNRVTLANVQDTVKVKAPVAATGEFQADVRVTGPILKPIVSGSVANIKPVRIDRVDFRVIRSRFAFSTAASAVTLKDIQVIPAVGGKITGAGKIALGQPGIDFNVVAQNVPGDAIARLYGVSSQIKIGTVEAIAKISGTPTNLQTVVNWQAPSGTYPAQGKLVIAGTDTLLLRNTVVKVAGGTVRAGGQVADGRWQASVQAANVQLGRLAQVPPALRAPLSGTFNFSGSTASFKPESISLQGSGRFNIAGGTVTASKIQLAGGRWQGSGTVAGVQVRQLLPQLTAKLPLTLDGRYNLSGSLAAITPETIQGNGSGSLQVADGKVTATNVTLRDGRWQGSFAADGVEIENLAQFAPSNVPAQLQGRLSGNVNASGSVAFNLASIQAFGQLRLLSFAVNGLNFDPLLTGEVNVAAGQGVNLQLAGVQDRIELVLSPTYRPVSFFVRRDEATVTGRTQGELLLVRSDNFPLSILKTLAPLPAVIASQPVSGVLSANLAINLNKFAAEGNVAIKKPGLGTFSGDSFVGQLRYANGVTTLTGGEFTQGESRYALRGAFTQSPSDPKFQGQVNITQGQVQNIITAIQSFDLQNFQQELQPAIYARANAVQTVPVGLPEASLLTQLRRFSEIEALVQQQSTRAKASQPGLADLKGSFNGEISLNGSLKTGVAVKFDLEGQNWQWDTYKANRLIVQGNFENGVLSLVPLRIESDETLLAFNGQVGGTKQSGRLQVSNFPVDVLKNFVTLPVDYTGQLNAVANLGGSRQNPQIAGQLQLNDGTLNQKPIESAQGKFSYANARLNFASNVLIAGPNPIAITASVPYALPFASVKPDSNEIRLDLNVQNEGLAVVNLLTNSFAWEGGQGQVQLQVRGTREQPVATGTATINNATISAPALPEPLTDVRGVVQFNRDRIQVEGVQGSFSRGNVQARGVIPIFANLKPNDPDQANPLTVTLNELKLNLEGLYQGGASGNVEITGSALNPIIGGDVQLAQGEVNLSQAGADATTPALSDTGVTSSGATTKQIAPAVGNAEDGTIPKFNDLRLTLGEGIEITRPPILNIQATGTLTINGNRSDLRPDGTIRLLSGGINLFTTEFDLERDYEHTATFSPNQGLDPTLDIRLVSTVSEVTQSRVPNSPLSAEINQPLSIDLGAVDTVRVQARVQGPASELADNLELTSNPARSETEIVALLGGGFIQTLGRGGSEGTLGLANFAGSALLDNFQGTFTNIGNTLGLSELRLYPTVITSEEDRSSSSTLGLAVEAGVDISSNVFVSAIRVLTADQPTQFGLNYRVNDQLRLRSSTDLSGDTRALVEYENRF